MGSGRRRREHRVGKLWSLHVDGWWEWWKGGMVVWWFGRKVGTVESQSWWEDGWLVVRV